MTISAQGADEMGDYFEKWQTFRFQYEYRLRSGPAIHRATINGLDGAKC